MFILVINAGSSSLKYQLVDKASQAVLAKGLCERVGIEGSFHKYEINGAENQATLPLKDHHDAVKAVLEVLLDPTDGVVKSLDEIVAVGTFVKQGSRYVFEIASLEVKQNVKGKYGIQ